MLSINDKVRIIKMNGYPDGKTGTIVGLASKGIISIWIVEGDEPFEDSEGEKPWKCATIPECCLEKLRSSEVVKTDHNGYIEYRLNGKLHREDGLAYENPNGTKYWYLNGKKLTKEEFEQQTKKGNQPSQTDLKTSLNNLFDYTHGKNTTLSLAIEAKETIEKSNKEDILRALAPPDGEEALAKMFFGIKEEIYSRVEDALKLVESRSKNG